MWFVGQRDTKTCAHGQKHLDSRCSWLQELQSDRSHSTALTKIEVQGCGFTSSSLRLLHLRLSQNQTANFYFYVAAETETDELYLLWN